VISNKKREILRKKWYRCRYSVQWTM
jgi:hypothetical protein